jgi:ribosomal protein L19
VNVDFIQPIIKKIIMADLMKFVQDEFVTRKEFPVFAAGDTITVYYEIREGEKTRTQFFKGVVIQRRGSANTETFTIRKMSGAIGVERIFPVELEFSTSENLLVKKLKLKIKEDSSLSLNYKSPNSVGTFFVCYFPYKFLIRD